MALELTDANFQETVLDSDKLSVVDFWAEWCGPCKMIAPALEQIAEEYDGRLKVCKIDVDANNETPVKYSVRGIPTLILFKDGNADATKVGALSKTQLKAFIDNAL